MFEIHTLRVGELHLPEAAGILRDPIHCWLVSDGSTRILVDSGMPDIAEVGRRLNVGGEGGGQAALRDELAKVGVAPDDIDFVVLTHLHFDHAWNLDLFPDACVVVQRDEAIHALEPVATQRIYYFRETLIRLLERKRPAKFRLVHGDTELVDGVRLLKAPGHTPGMQVPVVTTTRGKAALVSDLGDHYRNWYPDDPRASDRPLRFMAGALLPGTIRSESESAHVESMRRVMDAADIVVPAHDFRIPRHLPKEWFAIPESTEGDLARRPAPSAAE